MSSTFLPANSVDRPPQPLMKYCMTMLIMFDATQYRARPLGNCRVKKANIRGIIQSIIRPWACWAGSADSGVIIFCWSHIDPPTSMGISIIGSGTARSNQRNLLSSGTRENTCGQVS